MSRTKTFGIGLLLAAGTALVLWSSCSGSHPEPKAGSDPAAATTTAPPGAVPEAAATQGATDPSATARGSAGNGALHDSAAGSPPSTDADAGSAPPDGPGASIVRAVSASDPKDLAFLARIERELGKSPPPEVHALVERRKQGASRDELTRRSRELPDLQLRVLALRWVDDVFGGADAGTSPAVPASGSASPLVKPVRPVR